MIPHFVSERAAPGAALGRKLWQEDPDLMTVSHSRAVYKKDQPMDFSTYIDEANLFSDGYCELSLRSLALVSLIIAVALKRKVDIREVRTQVRHINFYGKHDAIFDVEARDSEGNYFIIEVQRKNRGMSKERILFYHSIAYVGSLEEAVDYKDGHKRYVIVISQDDIFGIGKTMDSATFCWRESGFWEGCGMEVVYMNASYIDMSTDVGRLMHDFLCTNVDEMVYAETRELAQYYKNSKAGKEEMTFMFEDVFRERDKMVFADGHREGKAEGKAEGIEEGIASANRNTVIWLLKNGFTPDFASRATGMQLPDVLELKSSVGIV